MLSETYEFAWHHTPGACVVMFASIKRKEHLIETASSGLLSMLKISIQIACHLMLSRIMSLIPVIVVSNTELSRLPSAILIRFMKSGSKGGMLCFLSPEIHSS
jgi:hypothetical protein